MHATRSPIIEVFRQRTQKSAQLAEQAAQLFPGGVTHDGRYLQPYPIYVERATSSRKWDVDGHEYVDYSGGHGALLLGHNHPTVTQAATAQLAKGTHYGSCHELEVRWGQIVQRLIPCAERIRFTGSGTEATLLALRLSRAFTGKSKILRFSGHFHGWHDHAAFGVYNHYDGTPTPGVLDEVAQQVVLAPAGNIEATRAILNSRHDIAAVIVEPTGASWGQVPILPEFLSFLREETAQRGIVLTFDEVISGFRVSPGGAQAHFGITPDLTTLAKIVAGGMPGGAIVGRQSIMDALDFAATQASGKEKIPHQGTFNANPVCAAAGIATLEIVASTDACRKASDYAARLRDELNRVLYDEKVPWAVYGTFSGFHIFTNPDGLDITPADIAACKYDYRVLKKSNRDLVTKLRLGMLIHGVEIFAWPGGPTSSLHTDDDLRRTVEAFRSTLRMLRDDGAI